MTKQKHDLETRLGQIKDGFDYLVTVSEYNEAVNKAKTQRELDAVVKRFGKQLDKQGVTL
jgi:response regulator RpfG family c-di-GMP phosphodiesterase